MTKSKNASKFWQGRHMSKSKSRSSKLTAKAFLATLTKFMRSERVPFAEKQHLWSVLTALRGPDNDDEELKFATACVVRGALHLPEPVCGYVQEDDEHKRRLRAEHDLADGHSSHYLNHERSAFHALGLRFGNEYVP